MESFKIYDSALDNNGYVWNCFYLEFQHSKFVNKECIVTGTLRLWDGEHTIVPCVCNDVLSAIRQCASDNEIIIHQHKNHIEVYSYHHDGINHYQIYLLNSKGLKAHHKGSYADLTKPNYHRVLRINKLFL